MEILGQISDWRVQKILGYWWVHGYATWNDPATYFSDKFTSVIFCQEKGIKYALLKVSDGWIRLYDKGEGFGYLGRS